MPHKTYDFRSLYDRGSRLAGKLLHLALNLACGVWLKRTKEPVQGHEGTGRPREYFQTSGLTSCNFQEGMSKYLRGDVSPNGKEQQKFNAYIDQ